MDRSFFAKRDHFFRERADRFGFCQGGANALMLDQTANLICQQRFSVLGSATTLYRFLLVSHRAISRRAMVVLCALPLHSIWEHRLQAAFPPARDQTAFPAPV